MGLIAGQIYISGIMGYNRYVASLIGISPDSRNVDQILLPSNPIRVMWTKSCCHLIGIPFANFSLTHTFATFSARNATFYLRMRVWVGGA